MDKSVSGEVNSTFFSNGFYSINCEIYYHLTAPMV